MHNPLIDPPPSEVRLAAAPLGRVLGVAQFSPVMKISDVSANGIASFQELIRGDYPGMRLEQETVFQVQVEHGQVSPPLQVTSPVWRFFDREEAWRVTLTRETLGIETKDAYTNRDDFVGRLGKLLGAVQSEFQPAQRVRVGVRYVNVFTGELLGNLTEMVKPELLGFGAAPFVEQLDISQNQAVFRVPEGRLSMRWGINQPGMTYDPSILGEAIERRYFLDLDAFDMSVVDFSSEGAVDAARRLTERVYTMFRWAVSSSLLEGCNAKG